MPDNITAAVYLTIFPPQHLDMNHDKAQYKSTFTLLILQANENIYIINLLS